MTELSTVGLFMFVFYCGAVVFTARAWLQVIGGAARLDVLRDLTGITDPATLTQYFGLRRQDGAFRVTFAGVVRHRRLTGLVIGDLPVHLLFVAALGWALLDAGSPAAAALIVAAAVNAAIVGAFATRLAASGLQALRG